VSEQATTKDAFDCMEAGHWEMKDTQPYVCMGCFEKALRLRDSKARAEQKEADARVCDNASVIEFAKGMQTNDEARMAIRLAKTIREGGWKGG